MNAAKLVFDRDPKSIHRGTGRTSAQISEVERRCQAGEPVLYVTCYRERSPLPRGAIIESSPQRLAYRLCGLSVRNVMLDHAAPRAFAEALQDYGMIVMSDFYDLSLTSPWNVAEFMGLAKDEKDWNRRCDVIKAENGGSYPKFWFENILKSGLAAEKFRQFAENVEKRMEAKAVIPAVTIKPERPFALKGSQFTPGMGPIQQETPTFQFSLDDIQVGLRQVGLRAVPELTIDSAAEANPIDLARKLGEWVSKLQKEHDPSCSSRERDLTKTDED